MAYSKIILNGETLMDVTSDTVAAGSLLSGKTATKNDGTKVTGNIASKTASDLTVSGSTVTAAAGYYPSAVSKGVATTTHPNPTATIASSTGVVTASHTQGTGYVTSGTTTGTLSLTTQAGKTITPTESAQTAVASYRWTTGPISVAAISSTYVGTGVTTRSAADMTVAGQSVTAPAGYYSEAFTKAVTTTTHPNPTATFVSSTGAFTATHAQTAGYVGAGTTTSTYNLTTQAATTYNTSTSDQTITSNRWLTGTQTIKSVTTTNLTAANIAEGVVVKVGDANNASRIKQVTGTYAPALSSVTVTPTETTQTFNATGVYGYKPVTVNGISSTYVGTGIARKSSSNLAFNSNVALFTAPSGYYSADATLAVNASGTKTIYPSTADQTVASYTWLTGTQTFKSVTTTNLTAANIVSGTVVKVGDSGNASRITQVTGTFSGIIPTGTSTITSNGTYDVKTYASASVSVAGGEYYNIYKAIFNDHYLYSNGSINAGYTSEEVLAFCNSFSVISSNMFIGVSFRSSFTFANVTSINYLAFGCTGTPGAAHTTPDEELFFPALTSIGGSAFYNRINLKKIEAINCKSINYDAFCGCTGLTTLDFPSCTTVSSRAFMYCDRLTAISFPVCTTIDSSAFSSCVGLTTISFPSCTSIGSGAFMHCSGLTAISFPVCTTIGSYAFAVCSGLTAISFPSCTTINYYAFASCKNLSIISFPSCTAIGSYAFSMCYSLTTVSFPVCTIINNYAFTNCSSLTTANFPACTTIGTGAFYYCSGLTAISFPSCTTISNTAFNYCYNLTIISLPLCAFIANSAFTRCFNLVELHLESVSSVPTLESTYAFISTPLFNYSTSAGRWGSIFVPASLYASFQTASVWSNASIKARLVSV